MQILESTKHNRCGRLSLPDPIHGWPYTQQIDNTPESNGLSDQIQPQDDKSPLAARYNDGLSSFGNDMEEQEVSGPNDSKNPKLGSGIVHKAH